MRWKTRDPIPEVVLRLYRCALRLETENVEEYASYLADMMDENKDKDSADRLRRIISGEPQNVIKTVSK